MGENPLFCRLSPLRGSKSIPALLQTSNFHSGCDRKRGGSDWLYGPLSESKIGERGPDSRSFVP